LAESPEIIHATLAISGWQAFFVATQQFGPLQL
jgi:hypothetical protein